MLFHYVIKKLILRFIKKDEQLAGVFRDVKQNQPAKGVRNVGSKQAKR